MMRELPPSELMKGNILTFTEDIIKRCNRAEVYLEPATYGHVRPVWTSEEVSGEILEFFVSTALHSAATDDKSNLPLWQKKLLSRTFIDDHYETGGACVLDKKPFGNTNYRQDIQYTLTTTGHIEVSDIESIDHLVYMDELFDNMMVIVNSFKPEYNSYEVVGRVGFHTPVLNPGEILFRDCILIPHRNFCDRVRDFINKLPTYR
jgi:hypothetical protein